MNSRVVAAMNCFLKGNRRTATFSVLLVIVLAQIGRVDATDKLDEAIQRIESLGSQIKRDDKLPGRPVTEVTFRGEVFEENAPLLRFFTNLRTLDLDSTNITDAGLKELGGLNNLMTLDLDETKITDAGLKELSGFKNLKTLSVMSTSTTDAGVTELRKTLPNVEIYQ